MALHGLSKLLETTALVSRRINPALKEAGIVICMYESATRLGQEVIAEVKKFLDDSRGTKTPWVSPRSRFHRLTTFDFVILTGK